MVGLKPPHPSMLTTIISSWVLAGYTGIRINSLCIYIHQQRAMLKVWDRAVKKYLCPHWFTPMIYHLPSCHYHTFHLCPFPSLLPVSPSRASFVMLSISKYNISLAKSHWLRFPLYEGQNIPSKHGAHIKWNLRQSHLLLSLFLSPFLYLSCFLHLWK